MAIAQVLANWFNAILEGNGDMPNKDGDIVFEISYTAFLRKACVTEINSTLRKHLKKYGFKILKRGGSLEIIKHN